MKFSIVIPVWNSLALLQKNLPAVVAVGADEIIIGDDASTDASLAFLRKNYPSIKVVSHPRLGFAGNVNAAVRQAEGDIVVLLNTDVLPEKNFLQPLVKDFADSRVFGVSCNEINHPHYGPTRGIFDRGYITHEPRAKTPKTVRTFWVSGGSGAFRKSMWNQLGGFDESFRFYWEDIDLAYRAQKRGWLCLWNPAARVVHEHEGTIKKLNRKKMSRLQERNQLLFIWKNLTDTDLWLRHFIGLLLRFSHPGYFIVFLQALTQRGYIVKMRKKEQKETKTTDRQLLFNS